MTTAEGGNRRSRIGPVLLVVALVVAVTAAGWTGYRLRHRSVAGPAPDLRVSGVPASVPTSLANLMQLGPLPGQAAPGFDLTDQTGRRISLDLLRGRAVVLEFMDPYCVDICPIVSQEYVGAYRDLGARAADVEFLAVNVNPYHLDTASMARYSSSHGLAALPNWHFLTGPLPVLQRIWRAYHIAVTAPSTTADVIHTSAAYFIDPAGRERYIAFPMVDHTAAGTAYLPTGPLTEWSRGISLVLQSLL